MDTVTALVPTGKHLNRQTESYSKIRYIASVETGLAFACVLHGWQYCSATPAGASDLGETNHLELQQQQVLGRLTYMEAKSRRNFLIHLGQVLHRSVT